MHKDLFDDDWHIASGQYMTAMIILTIIFGFHRHSTVNHSNWNSFKRDAKIIILGQQEQTGTVLAKPGAWSPLADKDQICAFSVSSLVTVELLLGKSW